MTLETYLAIALLHMGQDALQTHEAKIPYRARASLVWSLIWPFTAALMIAMVIYRQRKPNSPLCVKTANAEHHQRDDRSLS